MELIKVNIFKRRGETLCKATFRNEGTLVTMTKIVNTIGDHQKALKLASGFTAFFKPEIAKLPR